MAQKNPKGDGAGGKEKSGKGLSREIVLDAALDMIDRLGFDRFSMRGLSSELDVCPTTLYWHLQGGRESLLSAIVARALEHVLPPAPDGDDWENWLRRLFHLYRDTVMRRPNLAPVIGAQMVPEPGVKPVLPERILTVLSNAGLSGDRLVDAYNAVIAAMVGYMTLELAPEPKQQTREWAEVFRQQLETLSPEEFPHITANLPRLANRAYSLRWHNGARSPLSGGFDVFVEAFLTGLRSMIEDGA